MKTLVLTILTLFVTRALACEVQKMDSLNLMISTPENAFIAYQSDRPLQDLPYFRATNCSDAAMGGKFLMVAFGPEVVEFEDFSKGINFTGEYGYKRCELTDSPFGTEGSHESRLGRFKDDWHFIRSCLDVIVEDESPQKLGLPPVQPGCTLNKITNHKASFNGGFCFFKPGFGTSYIIKIQVKPECTDVEKLKRLKIKTSDLSGAINVYLSGDASGSSSSLKALSNTNVRVSINPLKKLLAQSDDFGLLYPTWPENWSMPDVHLAKIKLRKTGSDRIMIETPFLVNNNCMSKCDGEFCQSACDYAQPIVSEFYLYDVSGGKKELLTNWYDGGVAQPHFVGTIQGAGFEVPTDYIEAGKEYLIETRFVDPKMDFEQFKKRIKNKLNRLEQQLGKIGNSNIPSVQVIPTIVNGQEMPGIGTIPNLVFGNRLDGVTQAVEYLRSYFSFRLWPPYYAGVCAGENCIALQDDFLVLGMQFKVLAEVEGNMELPFEEINIYRRSKLVRSYDLKTPYSPLVKCEYAVKESL